MRTFLSSRSSARLRLWALAVLAAVAVAACGPQGAGSPRAAATVNGDEVPVSQVRERFETVRDNPQLAEQLEGDDSGEFADQVQAEILSSLIRSRLLEQGASKLDVEVTDDDVDEQRAEIVEEVGGEEAFADLIEQNGLTEEQVRSQLRDLALQERIAEELSAEADVDREEVRAFYEENYGSASARHILVETEEEARNVIERLEEGEDFAEVAQDVSIDPSAEQNAGDLGEFQRGQMVPEFTEAVFNAEEGDIVGPVETQFGYHVIEVTNLDEGPGLSEVEDDIREQLSEGQSAELVQAWLDEQSREADIEVNPRFGEWDPEAGRVVPSDPLDEGES